MVRARPLGISRALTMTRQPKHPHRPVVAHARKDFTTLRRDWPARQALVVYRRGLTRV